jgi:ubiquinone/menaquinone biosynthesis C-methylase UbiE
MQRKWFMSGIAALAVTAAATGLSARQLASRPVDDWTARLERPDRVADMGAGPGVLSLPIAKAVAPGGKVYAVEIEQGFLDRIAAKGREAGVTNIVTVLGAFSDPKLPARDVDVALFHDVLHHIKERAEYLKATARYLKPGGRIAVVELPPDGSHKDEPELVVTKDQVKGWMADAGFAPVREFDGLTGKWFVVYGRR